MTARDVSVPTLWAVIDRPYSCTKTPDQRSTTVRSGDAVRCKIARLGKRKWQSCAVVPDSVTVTFREEVHYMKRSSVLFYLLVLCVATGAGALLVQGQGRGQSPEAQARQKQQLELEAATPKLQITE